MLQELIAQDILRYLNQSPEHRAAGDNWKTRLSAMLSEPVQCAMLYRLSHWCWRRNWRRIGRGLAYCNAVLFKANISPAAEIGPGLFLPHPPGTTFCGRAGRGLTMYSIATCCPAAGWGVEDGPVLGDGVTVGAHAIVQGSVRIGDGARIGFAVSIDRDAPCGVLVVSRAMRMTVRTAEAAGA